MAARWIARTTFQQKVYAAHPAASQSNSVRGRGQGTGHGAGARCRKAPKVSPDIDIKSQGELNPQTILGCGSGSESHSEGPARRGRVRGRGFYTRRAAQQAKEADQSSNQPKGLAFPLVLKPKKGHRRSRSDSRGHSQDRQKCHSRHSSSEDTAPSSEDTATPEQAKQTTSATLTQPHQRPVVHVALTLSGQ